MTTAADTRRTTALVMVILAVAGLLVGAVLVEPVPAQPAALQVLSTIPADHVVLSDVSGIAVDGAGNVYALIVERAGSFDEKVVKFGPNGGELLRFGSTGQNPGQFAGPMGLTVDAAGNIYVADTLNDRIQKFDAAGNLVLTFGSRCILDGGGWCVDLDGDGPLALGDGQFWLPQDVAVDAAGNIYVADSGNRRIQKFDGAGNFLLKFGSQGNADGQFGAPGSQFAEPTSLAISPSGHLYATEFSNRRVQKFDANGNFVSKFGAEGTGNGQFAGPGGIGIDAAGNVYVVDNPNHRVQKFDASDAFVLAFGTEGTGEGELFFPWDLAADAAGNLYVFTLFDGRIQKFDAGGAFLRSFVTSGAAPGQLNGPFAAAADSSGNVWIADSGNHRIQKFDAAGVFVLAVGAEGALEGEFSFPAGVATDGLGNVYVADAGNNRIQKFDASGSFIVAFDGSDSGAGALSFPLGVAVDGSGQVWVADSGNDRVMKFDATGAFLASTGSSGSADGEFSFPVAVAVDGAGSVYVADSFNNRVQKLDSNGDFQLAFGTFGSGDGELDSPAGVAVDGAGSIWVVDTTNARIQKFDAAGNFVLEFGTAGAGHGQLYQPFGISVDSAGRLYVSDSGNHRIQVIGSPDGDADGILDEVDTAPGAPSNDFSDVPLGGTTTGAVTSRGDQVLTIGNEANPAGVRITSAATGGPAPATVSGCGGAALVTLTPGDDVVVTCGSATVTVIAGPVAVAFVATDGTAATLVLGSGNSLTFIPETSTLIAPSSNTAIITVTVGGAVFSAAPGHTVSLALHAAIDIKPGGFPNAINPRARGVIPVAILTTGGFGATTLDPAHVRFGPLGAPAVKATPQDVDGDGDVDLVLHFAAEATGIACGQTTATLTGRTRAGVRFDGRDSIRTVGCK